MTMIEHIYLISFLTFSLSSVFLLSRVKLIPAHKTGIIERYGVFYKPIAPGIHFLVPFVDKMVIYDTHRKLSLYREIVYIAGIPKASVTLDISYRIMDEKDYHEHNVDQFIRNLCLDVTRLYIENYGTSIISEQRVALKTRLKGAILERVVEWGIELTDLDLLMIMEIK